MNLRRLLQLLCIATLLCANAHATQQVESPAYTRQPPRFPPELVAAGAEGTTVLIITHDQAGKVLDVVVEKSSGYAQFDQAAIEAAKTWTMPAPVDGGKIGRARVPVDFKQPETPAYFGTDGSPMSVEAQRTWYRAWQQMQVAAMYADEDGNLPPYLQDDLPLPADNARDLIAWLKANATLMEQMDDGVVRYRWQDGPSLQNFEVFDDGYFNPTVIRHRLVTDGTQAFWMQRYVCDAADKQACANFEAMIREMPPQPSLNPPPNPPPPPPPPPPGTP